MFEHFEENETSNWQKPRGPVTDGDGQICIGRVGAPPMNESTSDRFFFWIPPSTLVEKTQLVTCKSTIAGKLYTFYAIVDEVRRQSRQRSMSSEVDQADGDLSYEPPFKFEGITYAQASILRTEPPVLTAPLERSEVFLASEEDAFKAYGADEVDNPLAVGLIKNGGEQLAGPGFIDLDYLLGANGGHLNVNGAAGRGTKSSFLLTVNWLLLKKAREQEATEPSNPSRLRIVPIIFNVKNFDLFYIDKPSTRFIAEKHLSDWNRLDIETPAPFSGVAYFAAQQPATQLAIQTGRGSGVKPYSWSLSDIIERNLLSYLFAETDANDANFGALILDIENWLTRETVAGDGTVTRHLQGSGPATFNAFVEWVKTQSMEREDNQRDLKSHHTATWKKLHRRLIKLTYESKGVLRRDEQKGHPLELVKGDTADPQVVDLSALSATPEMQRFVVATLLRQLVEARTGASAVPGLIYLVTLDELNRFAPRGAHDPITQLIETVAAEMRSQGIILLGAQQQASKVSDRIIENCGIRALGKTGTLELATPGWRFLSDSARQKVQALGPDEKLIVQDNFREPMHVRVPFPVWAMNPREAVPETVTSETAGKFSDLLKF
ncbi:MAG: ATP-binding protein [Chloroflexi bacterium]|uniref:ATP-binding protein n=1 Tax=Candidatus Chlorohelix allophototropha TaxID=3003348 RepID=A0A8T7M4N8_9CHLR|nr:ATP-binding protein [Chloroflexota bacterium]WJW70356.1 ATP-binding protein [Chloroflexota bacterium L227-S17]